MCVCSTQEIRLLRFTCVFNTKVTTLETKMSKRVNLWPHYSLHSSIFNGSVCVYSSFPLSSSVIMVFQYFLLKERIKIYK